MFRKSLNLIFKRKRNIMKTDSTEEENNDDTDTVRIFKKTFINRFELFKLEAAILAEGHIEFDEGWRETLLREGVGLSTAVVVGVIALLGALMVISAAVSAGIAIPVAVVGAVAVVAFHKYREHVKKQRYIAASNTMDRDAIGDNIQDIADLLANLYQVQLAGCAAGDARLFADACFNAISLEMLKNKNFHFNELLDQSSLQAVLTRANTKIPKHKLSLNIRTDEKLNTRGMITHAAYYCRDTEEFYHASDSKNKYGVLFFDTKADLKGYEVILNETMKHGKRMKLTKMDAHEVNALMASTMFKAYKNDRHFDDRMMLEENDKNKLTLV